jgi:hypothetical protein
VPQTRRPPGQLVPAGPVPSSLQLRVHWALPEQLTVQAPAHFTSQLEESMQVAELPGPRLSLHEADDVQVAVVLAPAFTSQLLEALHATWLPAPACPLQSDES